MASRLRNFDKMWNAYPNPGEGSDKAKATIGGAVDADWVTNTCVIRVSRCFNKSSNRVPKGAPEIKTLKGKDGKRYAFRVKEFRRYLKRKYGAPTLTHRYAGDAGGEIPDAFRGKQGVICFVVKGWTDATGHYDLWNGTQCRHAAYFNRAASVELWEVADATEVEPLAGSVGRRGRNATADVKRVQELLDGAGFDPGNTNGRLVRKTRRAIRRFQRRFLSRPDGRIDPDGRSWRELTGVY